MNTHYRSHRGSILAHGSLVLWVLASLEAQPVGLLSDLGRYSFDVANVKPSRDATETSLGTGAPGRFEATGVTVVNMIRAAFGGTQGSLPASRIIGGPQWISQNRWDVVGKVPEDPSGFQVMLKMLQTLLRDRFHLKLHTEQRYMPVYDLVRDKPEAGGAKIGASLSHSSVDCDAMLANEAAGSRWPEGFWCGIRFERGNPFVLKGRGVAMSELCRRLEVFGALGRSILDRTSLSGTWDFELRFVLPFETTEPSSAPDIVTAVREQLGLKLESSRSPVEVLVIDDAQLPEPN
jgi:uncharacterized protein (TIGR03435 family)